jgi:spermidine synthase
MLGTKILEERESKYNGHLKVVKTLGMGTYIQAGGLTQSGGIVETIWKSTLKQIKDTCENILILGLGGGTLAKLLRKKYPKAKITGVEIDPIMIELGKKYLDLDKYNIDIKIQDAFIFLKNNKNKKYDLLIVDTYFGDKVAEIAGSDPAMAEITVFNRLYFGDKRPDTVRFGNNLEKIFKKVTWFYPEANLMFICS